MSGKTAEVRYLFNSGFAVRVGRRLLIFDYCQLRPRAKSTGPDSGLLRPDDVSGFDVVVFASHAHPDHFYLPILGWSRAVPKIRYVLSHDIAPGTQPDCVTVAFPGDSFEVGGVGVRALKSTDEGVAFVVEADGFRIYHAGDLNWWHWEGEPDEENRAMADLYKAEIDKLRGETFDVAFVPVDPRLGEAYIWGLDYFMRTAEARRVFPMHFRNDYGVFDRLLGAPEAREYRGRIVRISRRGEVFEV